ncbi:MAG: GTP 3',8-cyclase MoaA [Planctomycetota bacterium]
MGLTTDRLNRPVRDLRISVTDRCNFRCPYCMPAEVFGEHYKFLPKSEILTFEEIERLARVFVGHGVKKLRVTGGEPLLRQGLTELVQRLAKLPVDLSLTTNGYLLARHAAALKAAGLHRLTISLDSLDKDVFEKMNGRGHGPEVVLEGLAAAREAGFGPAKINAVVQRGVNEHTLVELARHFKGSGHILRFIEFMDVGTVNGWDLAQVVTKKEILELLGAEFALEPVAPNYAGEVATRFRYKDGSGEIGIISSVSEPFCGGCTRARLSPKGELMTCLFGSSGTDLRTPLRNDVTDDELSTLVGSLWSARADRYSEKRSEHTEFSARRDRIEMFRIGG